MVRMILGDLPSKRVGAALLTTAAVVLAACGGDDGGGSAPDASVIATTSIWADITSSVACGAPIASLIPPGSDPHTFEPSLRDRELIENATTVISNGLGLEDSLSDLLDTASNGGVNVIGIASAVEVITDDEGDDDAERGDEGDDDNRHDHRGEGDPHVWQDPLRVAEALDTIGSALAASDIDVCVAAYRDELLALDDEIETRLADVPAASRVLVTSHDSLAYFADRYGFEIIGTVISSTSTIAETNAADLAALAAVIEEYDVPAIFTEELESTADADALAARLDVAVVPLVTDSLTADPDTDTYVEMMRHNAAAIASALAP